MALTIIDVAKRSGVSPSTVSLVINQKSNVSAATVSAVCNAMNELGYVPKLPENRRGPRVGNTNTKRTKRVCLLAYNLFASVLYSPIYISVLKGIDSALQKNGLQLQINHISLDHEPSSLDWLKGSTDGIIFMGNSPRAIDQPLFLQFPCVQVMGEIEGKQYWDHITYDNSAIGGLAAQHLQINQHKSCIILSQRDKLFSQRVRDFQRTFAEFGGESFAFEDSQLFLITSDCHQIKQDRLRQMCQRLLQDPRPTAAFLTADNLAPSFYCILHEMGIKPGVDIEIVSCNKEDILLEGLIPRPASIDIQATNIGHRGVEQLLWRMNNRDQPFTKTVLLPSIASTSPDDFVAQV